MSYSAGPSVVRQSRPPITPEIDSGVTWSLGDINRRRIIAMCTSIWRFTTAAIRREQLCSDFVVAFLRRLYYILLLLLLHGVEPSTEARAGRTFPRMIVLFFGALKINYKKTVRYHSQKNQLST